MREENEGKGKKENKMKMRERKRECEEKDLTGSRNLTFDSFSPLPRFRINESSISSFACHSLIKNAYLLPGISIPLFPVSPD